MKWILTCFAMSAMILLAVGGDASAATKKKHVAKKGTAKKSTAKKGSSGKTSTGAKPATATAGKGAPSRKSGTATASRGKKGKSQRSATTWRNRQTLPSPDRYREIQTALAAKGYLKPEDATGSWNANSTDALKKFQAEQNLESSGKINSLSLIALGLGPHHEATPVATPQPAAPASATPVVTPTPAIPAAQPDQSRDR
jgi:hypothetical protein